MSIIWIFESDRFFIVFLWLASDLEEFCGSIYFSIL